MRSSSAHRIRQLNNRRCQRSSLAHTYANHTCDTQTVTTHKIVKTRHTRNFNLAGTHRPSSDDHHAEGGPYILLAAHTCDFFVVLTPHIRRVLKYRTHARPTRSVSRSKPNGGQPCGGMCRYMSLLPGGHVARNRFAKWCRPPPSRVASRDTSAKARHREQAEVSFSRRNDSLPCSNGPATCWRHASSWASRIELS